MKAEEVRKSLVKTTFKERDFTVTLSYEGVTARYNLLNVALWGSIVTSNEGGCFTSSYGLLQEDIDDVGNRHALLRTVDGAFMQFVVHALAKSIDLLDTSSKDELFRNYLILFQAAAVTSCASEQFPVYLQSLALVSRMSTAEKLNCLQLNLLHYLDGCIDKKKSCHHFFDKEPITFGKLGTALWQMVLCCFARVLNCSELDGCRKSDEFLCNQLVKAVKEMNFDIKHPFELLQAFNAKLMMSEFSRKTQLSKYPGTLKEAYGSNLISYTVNSQGKFKCNQRSFGAKNKPLDLFNTIPFSLLYTYTYYLCCQPNVPLALSAYTENGERLFDSADELFASIPNEVYQKWRSKPLDFANTATTRGETPLMLTKPNKVLYNWLTNPDYFKFSDEGLYVRTETARSVKEEDIEAQEIANYYTTFARFLEFFIYAHSAWVFHFEVKYDFFLFMEREYTAMRLENERYRSTISAYENKTVDCIDKVKSAEDRVKQMKQELKVSVKSDNTKEDFSNNQVFNMLTELLESRELELYATRRKLQRYRDKINNQIESTEIEEDEVIAEVSLEEKIAEIQKHKIVCLANTTIPRITEELGIVQKQTGKHTNVANVLANDSNYDWIFVYTRKIGHKDASRASSVAKRTGAGFGMLNVTNYMCIVNDIYDYITRRQGAV